MEVKPTTQIKRLERIITGLLVIAIAPYLALLLFDIKSIITVIAGGAALPVLLVAYQLIKKLRYLKLAEFEYQGHIELDDREDVLSVTLLEPMSESTRHRILHSARVYSSSTNKSIDITYGSRQHVRARNERTDYNRLIELHANASAPLPERLLDTLHALHDYYQKSPNVSYGRSAFYYRDLRLVTDILDDVHGEQSESTTVTVDESLAMLTTKLGAVKHTLNEQKDNNLVVAADVLSADGRYY